MKDKWNPCGVCSQGQYSCDDCDIEILKAETKRLREALEVSICIDDFECPQCEADMETVYSNSVFHCKTCGNKYTKELRKTE